jgi:uncharacterized protein
VRVWIDLSNSPHPLLFAPVARRLEERGHEVLLTARDNAQTVELARERWDDVAVIGGPSPSGRRAKARTLGARVRALAAWARARRVDVALSHNSYAQLAAARLAGVRAVTAMDFEHQPANHAGFRLADVVLLPAALKGTEVRRQGATRRKARFYDGLKEEVYLGDFEPDPGVLAAAGVADRNGHALVVARTAPSRALYHRMGNDLFEEALRAIGAQEHVRCVVLTRHPEQREAIAAWDLPNVSVPERAVDSRSLMWASDLVLGAGGTMTREAALLGVPTLTLFAGREPAVDRWLMDQGRLARLESAEQLARVERRGREPHDVAALRARSAELVGAFVEAALSAPRRTAARPR